MRPSVRPLHRSRLYASNDAPGHHLGQPPLGCAPDSHHSIVYQALQRVCGYVHHESRGRFETPSRIGLVAVAIGAAPILAVLVAQCVSGIWMPYSDRFILAFLPLILSGILLNMPCFRWHESLRQMLRRQILLRYLGYFLVFAVLPGILQSHGVIGIVPLWQDPILTESALQQLLVDSWAVLWFVGYSLWRARRRSTGFSGGGGCCFSCLSSGTCRRA